MKPDIHPEYHKIKAVCACGNEIELGFRPEGDQGRNLFCLSSVFHRKTETDRHRRANREVQEKYAGFQGTKK